MIAARWIHDHYPDGATIAQTGSIAGHVQMATADPANAARYRDVDFDQPTGAFRGSGAEAGRAPDVVVVQECPLPYCDVVSDSQRRVLRDEYDRGVVFVAFDASSHVLAYDRDDAFYLPLAGFDAVARPGPTLTIYMRRSAVRK